MVTPMLEIPVVREGIGLSLKASNHNRCQLPHTQDWVEMIKRKEITLETLRTRPELLGHILCIPDLYRAQKIRILQKMTEALIRGPDSHKEFYTVTYSGEEPLFRFSFLAEPGERIACEIQEFRAEDLYQERCCRCGKLIPLIEVVRDVGSPPHEVGFICIECGEMNLYHLSLATFLHNKRN